MIYIIVFITGILFGMLPIFVGVWIGRIEFDDRNVYICYGKPATTAKEET